MFDDMMEGEGMDRKVLEMIRDWAKQKTLGGISEGMPGGMAAPGATKRVTIEMDTMGKKPMPTVDLNKLGKAGTAVPPKFSFEDEEETEEENSPPPMPTRRRY